MKQNCYLAHQEGQSNVLSEKEKNMERENIKKKKQTVETNFDESFLDPHLLIQINSSHKITLK